MADRFFPNVMPRFVTEDIQEEDKVIDEDSLMKLLSMPYTSLSKQFQRSGLDLKETVTRTSLFLFSFLGLFLLCLVMLALCVFSGIFVFYR
jgi:lipopolysaccharide/colanic/teichoic acid biosynthesis glycosyltransferase